MSTANTLSELADLQLRRPGVHAPKPIEAAWHRARARVLDHLAVQGCATRQAAEAARRRANDLDKEAA